MKRIVLSLAALAIATLSVNSYACEGNKKVDKSKTPQTQTTTTPSGPTTKDTAPSGK